MNDKVKCMHCKNFIYKLMLNGYHGYCEKHDKYTRFSYNCDEYECGRNQIYGEQREDEE